MFSELYTDILNIHNNDGFNAMALRIFKIQAEKNLVYREYIGRLNLDVNKITNIRDIPFLPIDFFKSRKVMTANQKIETIFKSSGTTGMIRSKHHLSSIDLYEQSFEKSFSIFYGDIKEYNILALLPSYIEQGHSSLVYMIDKLIKLSNKKASSFYMNNYDELNTTISYLEKHGEKTLLIGVSYALIDFFIKFPSQLKKTIIIETGGMKGRRKEWTKNELHSFLKQQSGVENINSEYGMTELLSQAYSKEGGIFTTPPWMKILIRDSYDPFSLIKNTQTGGINIIDLANINSCSFIETKDLGKLHNNNQFEVLGRFDSSEIRGCNLLVN